MNIWARQALIRRRVALGLVLVALLVSIGASGALRQAVGAETVNVPSHRAAAVSIVEQSFKVLAPGGGSVADSAEVNRIRLGAAAIGAANATAEHRAAPSPTEAIGIVRRATAASDYEIHVAAGTNLICLGVRTAGIGSLGCASPEFAVDPARPLMSVDYLGDGRWRISGLVINGTSGVVVTTPTDRQPAPISDNVFSVVVDGEPSAVAWRDAGGAAYDQKFANVPTPEMP